MAFILFLLTTLKRSFNNFYDNFYFYRAFGYYPPNGITISKLKYMKLGNNIALAPYCSLYCQDPDKGSILEIGNNVAMNRNVMINADLGGKIFIGDDVLFGPNVVLRASNHNFTDRSIPFTQQGHTGGTIVIENNVWLGSNVVVLPNVRIGTGSVIGAGSVVTNNVSPYSVYAGVPAKQLRGI